MKKATKIVLSLTTLGVLATSAFAYQSENFKGCMEKKQHKMMQMKHHKKGGHIIGAIMQLDLNEEQRKQIFTILDESRKSIEKPSKAFTASEFDKEMFVKLVKEQKEAKIEKKAQTIEKIYALLNSDQKKNLKVLLDKQDQFRGGKNFDKNCNGRG